MTEEPSNGNNVRVTNAILSTKLDSVIEDVRDLSLEIRELKKILEQVTRNDERIKKNEAAIEKLSTRSIILDIIASIAAVVGWRQ